MKYKRYHTIELFFLLLLAVSVVQAKPEGVWAQSNDPWSPLQLLYTSAIIGRPEIVADISGAVHIFWFGWFSEQFDGNYSIFYVRCFEDVCSEPVDVLLDPNTNDAINPEAVVDADGVLHVTFIGSGRLYHASAPANSADNVRFWTPPREIGAVDGSVSSPTGIAIDSNGSIHCAFATPETVYHVVSSDEGHTWSNPQVVFGAPAGFFTMDARLAVTSQNDLHVVWSMVPDNPTNSPIQGVFYTSSTDGGITWSQAQTLAGVDFGQPAILADALGNIHVAFNARVGIGGKYYTTSTDGGKTWTVVQDLGVPHSGTGLNSHPNLALDSSGNLHFVGGGDAFWLASWQNGIWSNPENLTSVFSNLMMLSLGYTERPDLSVSLGNQLHLVFYDVVEREPARIWHTWRSVNAPAMPPGSTIDPILESSPSATPLFLFPTPFPTGNIADSSLESPDLELQPFDVVSNLFPFVFAIGFSLLVVMIAAIYSIRNRQR